MRIKEIIRVLLVVGIGLAYVVIEPSHKAVWGQTQNPQTQQAQKLLDLAIEQANKRQPKKAIATLEQALLFARQQKDRKLEATILVWIGFNYRNIEQPQKALDYFNQSLPISREAGDRAGEATTLKHIGITLEHIGIVSVLTEQPQKALDYFKQSLLISRKVRDRAGEATTLNYIGLVFNKTEQPEKALDYFKQSLLISKKLGDSAGEATTLDYIGDVYLLLEQPEKALDYFNQSLLISRKVGDHIHEAITLNSIAFIYLKIDQRGKALDYFKQVLLISKKIPDYNIEAAALNNIAFFSAGIEPQQKILDYYNQSLLTLKKVGNPVAEATILKNIGLFYLNYIRQPQKAVAYYKQSLTRILKIRANITKDERIKFLQLQQNIRGALITSLIELKQFKEAYKWANLVTTVDLIDYTRLINAKVKDPAAQKAINEWNQLNQQLQFLRQKLQQKFSEPLSRQMRELENQVFKKGEEISQRFPEVAEIFEITSTDISSLQANIPTGTTVIYPVVLSDTVNSWNPIVLFVLTKNSLEAKQFLVNREEFNKLVQQTYEQLTNRLNDKYLDSLASLYNLLIAPVKAEIQATKPKQLSIIASGVLRYIPFDALYDSKNNQYLLEKYPVSYLTRLSARSVQSPKTNSSIAQKRVLAFGNPSPNGLLALANTETEVKRIADTLPGSKFLIADKATLDSFKVLAPQFPLLHLATHGCFQRQGCPTLKLEENVLVFADEKLKIADAAQLGLENVDLITLSACQTALQTDSSGKPFIDDNEASITGLAYLFERAGAKAVIANLWSIDDQATQDIMVKFYQNLKQGMSKTEALRQAKLTQIQKHPFFWSSFVLIGEPN